MSKSKPSVIFPWKNVCTLRKEIRERELKQEDFAVDLFLIVNRPESGGPFYCDPDQFFAITYATENLRKFCSGVLARLAGRADGVSLVNIAQTFGGGKTHALGTLYYLCTLGSELPKQHPAVAEILAASKLPDAPPARIAAVSFDKVDWKAGGLVKSPDGETRSFRMPWNLIAWQLLGKRGIEILQRNEDEQDYYEPPAQSLWMELFAEVEKQGIGALILLDEFLMWAHGAASPDPDNARQDKGPVWYDRLKNFFQTLAQAAAGSKKSCMVVSLLATDPAKRDDVGTEILARCNAGLNRQADVQTPVDRGDFAELLRRRMFESFPKGTAECDKYVTAFWHRLQAVEPARAKVPDSKDAIMEAYPFHPDLLNRLFGKWTELRQFQRTRGILQTFSMALREAETWDESPLVSTQIFLPGPGSSDELSPALEICQHCDRGQRYCSPACRAQARLEQRRGANHRHQRSLEGRLDHRDRQREYRDRRARWARVTDQGSHSIASPALSGCGITGSTPVAVPSRSSATFVPRWPVQRSAPLLRCILCGRSGYFVDPFPRIPRSG